MPMHVHPDPVGLPSILTRQEALEAGLSPDQIRHRVRGGHWRALATGVYLRDPESQPDPDTFEGRHADHARRAEAAQRARPDCVIGFGSAAVIHDLPLISGPPALVQLLVPDGTWTGIRGGVRYRECHLNAADVDRGVIAVTNPTRTWIDVARTHRLPDALSVGDAGVRTGHLDVSEAAWTLKQLGSIRGVRLASAALLLLDGKRETALESWSLARFVEWDLPIPQFQVVFQDEVGFVARVDFYWPSGRVVGESDGQVKYQTREVLYQEKRREDRLRALGLTVIRWGWTDLQQSGHALRTRLSAAVGR